MPLAVRMRGTGICQSQEYVSAYGMEAMDTANVVYGMRLRSVYSRVRMMKWKSGLKETLALWNMDFYMWLRCLHWILHKVYKLL